MIFFYDHNGELDSSKEAFWSQIFNNSFDEDTTTHHYMKRINIMQQKISLLHSIMSAITNKELQGIFPKKKGDENDAEPYIVPSDLCFLLRGEELNQAQ